MTVYTPDYWKIVEFDSEAYGKIQKVFGTWTGCYTEGSSWKLSSGNVSLVVDGDYYVVVQESGSEYRLHRTANGVHWSWEHLLDHFAETAMYGGAKFRVVPINELLSK